uniref:Dynein light chain n=1 Tax=Panagrolaimus sp. JU765 TaxID=591449 RepID=A0AC34Q362_9BILA
MSSPKTGKPMLRKSLNLSEDVTKAALELVGKAVDGRRNYVDMAEFIKKTFDTKFGGVWAVFVCKNGGSYVPNDKGEVVVDLDDLMFTIIKCRDAR